MLNEGGGIVGPGGQPLPDVLSADQQAISAEINQMMDNPSIKQYSMAILAGAQLSAWGEHHLVHHGKYGDQARMTMLQIIHSSMLNPDNSPRPFSEEHMAKQLDEMMPFVQARVKKHIKDAKKEAATIARAESTTDKNPKGSDDNDNSGPGVEDGPKADGFGPGFEKRCGDGKEDMGEPVDEVTAARLKKEKEKEDKL